MPDKNPELRSAVQTISNGWTYQISEQLKEMNFGPNDEARRIAVDAGRIAIQVGMLEASGEDVSFERSMLNSTLSSLHAMQAESTGQKAIQIASEMLQASLRLMLRGISPA